jgi:hypothetical protein
MKDFRLTLQHDNGKFNIRTTAKDEQTAREIVCKAEGCPDRAIIKVVEVKPRKRKLTALQAAKRLDFNTETEFFDYLIDSHINGQPTQCRELFAELKRKDRKNAVQFIAKNYSNESIYNFYFNQL